MKIEINFKHPYMDAKIIEELTIADLDCFYADADEVSSLNLFFYFGGIVAPTARQRK